MENDKIFPSVRIKETPNGTEITINGKKIDGVCRYSIEHKGGSLPILSLEFPAVNMDINERMIPVLPEVFREFYQPIHIDNPESTE